jgi:hypothetical protein
MTYSSTKNTNKKRSQRAKKLAELSEDEIRAAKRKET